MSRPRFSKSYRIRQRQRAEPAPVAMVHQRDPLHQPAHSRCAATELVLRFGQIARHHDCGDTAPDACTVTSSLVKPEILLRYRQPPQLQTTILPRKHFPQCPNLATLTPGRLHKSSFFRFPGLLVPIGVIPLTELRSSLTAEQPGKRNSAVYRKVHAPRSAVPALTEKNFRLSAAAKPPKAQFGSRPR